MRFRGSACIATYSYSHRPSCNAVVPFTNPAFWFESRSFDSFFSISILNPGKIYCSFLSFNSSVFPPAFILSLFASFPPQQNQTISNYYTLKVLHSYRSPTDYLFFFFFSPASTHSLLSGHWQLWQPLLLINQSFL